MKVENMTIPQKLQSVLLTLNQIPIAGEEFQTKHRICRVVLEGIIRELEGENDGNIHAEPQS